MAMQKVNFQAKKENSAKQVRERLLDAAEKLFIERGFDGTGVRELVSEARCNLAAVNYYFGGKDKLYKEMFRRHMERVFAKQGEKLKEIMESDEPTLEKLLKASVKTALEALYGGDGRIPVIKLLVREILNPHLREEFIAREALHEFLTMYRESLIKLLPGFELDRAMLSVFSLEGLILHPLLFFDFYPEYNPNLNIDELVEHIVEFASAGIRRAAEEN